MKRVALLVIVFLIALFTPRPTSAACRMLPPGQTCDTGQFPQKYSLNDGGSPQCTKGSNGQYNVCCDFESEANAADSVRAPICGSSQELGKANSSCWTCGGDLRCAGLDFGLKKDDTSPELFNKQAISPTDTIEDMDKVWRVDPGENFPETFRFNGIEYNRNGRGIVMCRSNVLGCGASDVSCTSALFPNEDITDEVTDDPNAGKPKQDTPDAHFGIEDGPDTKIVTLPGLSAGAQIPIKQRPFFRFLAGNQLIQKIFPIDNIFAHIFYTNDEQRFNDLRELGMTVESAFKKPLLPYQLQKQYRPAYWGEKLPTNYLPLDSAFRLCTPEGTIKRSEDDTEKDNIPLEGLTKSRLYIGEGDPIDDKFYYKALTGLRFFSAIQTTTQATLPGVDFYTPTMDIVPIRETICADTECKHKKYVVNEADLENVLYKCRTESAGASLPRTKTIADGVAEKGKNSNFFTNAAPIVVNFIGELLYGKRQKCDEKDENGECTQPEVFLQPTEGEAGGVYLGCAGNGCTIGDLDPKAPANLRNQLIKDSGADPSNPQSKGGAWNAYWPLALPELSKFHGSVSQNETLNREPGERKSYPFWTGGAVAAFDCVVKGMIMPKSIQDERNYSCYYTNSKNPDDDTTAPERGVANWSRSSSIPADFKPDLFQTSVKEAIEKATDGKIPACVLEGTKFIESGPEWIPGNTCLINQCSAAGPFQITVGVVQDGSGGWTNNCSQCGSGKACPDGWQSVSTWPEDPNAPSPCNINEAAERATKMLIDKSSYWTQTMRTGHTLDTSDPVTQKEGIILAGNSYVGSSQEWARLGGCSYGEFVYKHCMGGNYDCDADDLKFPHEQP